MKNWQRITELIRKTGDRFLVEDEQGQLFVILSASDYESIVLKNSQVKDLSEEELLNKINKDIAIWQTAKAGDDLPATWADLQEKVSTPEEDRYYFEPVEEED